MSTRRLERVEPVVDRVARGGVIDFMAGVFGTTRSALAFYDWLALHPAGAFAAVRDEYGSMIGSGAVLALGKSGWIGGIGVAEEARGRGLGTALTEWTIAWLEERGARTQGLLASELGTPIYRRLGFIAEGDVLTFAGPGAGVRTLGGRPLDLDRDDERQAVNALFASAHGEDRSTLVDTARGGWAIDGRDGELVAAALDCPWPLRPAVSSDPAAGTALLERVRAGRAEARIALPEANVAGCRALRVRGFRVTQRTTRMIRGPRPGFHPDEVFCCFSLVTG